LAKKKQQSCHLDHGFVYFANVSFVIFKQPLNFVLLPGLFVKHHGIISDQTFSVQTVKDYFLHVAGRISCSDRISCICVSVNVCGVRGMVCIFVWGYQIVTQELIY